MIRAPLGESYVSCVYAFLSNKDQSTYEEMLSAIVDKCEDLGFQPDPECINMDFESAAMNSVRSVFGPHVQVHGCFYHLTQSTWRKVQSLGLTTQYKDSEDCKVFCGMFDGLAFLPVDSVSCGLDYLKECTPTGFEPLLDYFDATYVSGQFRRIQHPARPDGSVPPVRLCPVPPLFPPECWNVHNITINNQQRTNNVCEGWNNSFRFLVGHSHPTVWRAIDSLKKDQATVATDLLRNQRGETLKKEQDLLEASSKSSSTPCA